MDKHKTRISQFQQILNNSNKIDLKKLKECCKSGGCPNESIRSLVWKILLNYLPCDKTKWKLDLEKQRNNYKEFIREFILRPGYKQKEDDTDIPHIDHPLNSNPNSEWSSYFKDNETLLQIDKDVRRLCPDLSFFQKATEYPCSEAIHQYSLRKRVANTQLKSHEVYKNRYGITSLTSKATTHLLSLQKSEDDMYAYKHLPDGQEAHWEVVERILFIFAKLNPGQGYIQGMNEICGPIYYTFATTPDDDDEYNWREHAEADCFNCFTSLMGIQGVRDNFVQILDNTEWGISSNMKRLYELLKHKDFDVYQVLQKQQLKPEFFAFRWLTLLLSQEFDLPDVIAVWDVLFADNDLFDLLLHICCSMIVTQRDTILKSDFSTNIKILQNYPLTNIHVLIDTAKQLR